MVEVPKKVNAVSVDSPPAFERRRVADLLPAIQKTDVIKKFFTGVADHLFQPEQSQKLEGYIGQPTAYTNYDQEFYLGEPTAERQVYQLEPTQITRDDTGTITDTLFYNDMANLIRLQGGLSENHARLFDTETYSWAPPVDVDMLMNFINYYWNGAGDPDYIVMQRGAQNGNPWSMGNHWVHQDELDPEMNAADANARQATRPIICFLRDLELFSYGTIPVPDITVQDSTTNDPRTELNGISNPVVDGYTVQPNDRVVFTNTSRNLANYSYTTQDSSSLIIWPDIKTLQWSQKSEFDNLNFYPGATIEIQNSTNFDGEYVIDSIDSNSCITLTTPFNISGTVQIMQPAGVRITEKVERFKTTIYEFRDTGSGFYLYPMENALDGMIATVLQGTVHGGSAIYYDAVLGNWLPAQTKTEVNQAPLFQLYDGQGTKLQDSGKYPGSTFTDGSKLFGYQINSDDRQPNDQVLGIPLFFDNQGDIVYENYLVTERYSWNTPKEEIRGYYYHKTDNGVDVEYSNDWYLKEGISQQRIVDRFRTTDDDVKKFTLSVAPDPIESVRVYVNEVEKTPVVGDGWTINGKEIEFDLFFATTDRLRITYFSKENLPTTAPGKYEIPVNLEANPDNLEVEFISNSQWFEHFTTLISNQDGFEGAPRGVNNYHCLIESCESELVQELLANDLVIYLEDVSQFPNSGIVVIDQEKIRYNSKDLTLNTLTVSNLAFRRINNSPNVDYPTGTVVVTEPTNDLSRGEKILQHRAPMLKTMLLGSNSDLDFTKAVRYSAREFNRFRNKLIRKLELFINDGIHTESQGALKWLEDAMRELNLGKTTDFPFAYSGMFELPSLQIPYIPASPSRLGVYPVYQPGKFFDLTYVGSNTNGQTTTFAREVLQFHDGSIMIAFGDFRDDVLLEMENRIYDHIPEDYKSVEKRPDFDLMDYVESAFRDGDYTRSEFNQVLLPIVQRWAIDRGLDVFKNTTYEQSNPFTYNYSSQGLPGYWRGIYKWFLDTDRPNTHPWEMFGFSQKPANWEINYGFAPYTYNPGTTDPNEQKHLQLWADMVSGLDRIRSGTVDEKYQRPGLNPPVDAQGNLLNPIAWGVASDPGVNGAQDWTIGDHGPVETVFRRSDLWPYAVAQLGYLLKPVRFIELGWEPLLQKYHYPDGANPQWVDESTDDRKRHSEYQVHGEVIDGERYLSNGINQWTSEYLVSLGKDITENFGDKVRGLEVVLGHRAAGFINQNATRILADNFGLVTNENINILTYLNPCVKEAVYSGVIVKRVAQGWEVQGYDILDPVFRVVAPAKTGRKTSVDVGSISVVLYLQNTNQIQEIPYGTVFQTQQEVHEFLVGYGEYQKTQGWIFDEVDQSTNAVNDWRLAGRQFLFWTLGNWAEGSIIALSPLAQSVKYQTEQGTVLNIERIVNGVYGLLNREGGIIEPRDTFVSRLEKEVVIVPNEFEAIFSARIIVAEYEHVMLFDNVTDFNDLIYDPLLSLRQPRLRVSTTRAGDWRGRIDAPGYMIQQDTILPNYDKMVTDFVKYFNIEDPVERPILQEAARNLIGYQERSYFGDLLISDVSQIQFYQGFIRSKGTKTVVDRLLRSNEAVNVDELAVYEEWALRVGEFGGVQDQSQIEFFLLDAEWGGQPQLVEFRGSKLSQPLLSDELIIYLDDVRQLPDQATVIIQGEEIFYNQKNTVDRTLIVPDPGQRRINNTAPRDYPAGTEVGLLDDKLDDAITIANNDSRWNIKPAKNGTPDFPVRDNRRAQRDNNANYYFRNDVKRLGYVRDVDVKNHVPSMAGMEVIEFLAQNYQEGDAVWVDNIGDNYAETDPRSEFNNSFMVYRYTRYGDIQEIDRRFQNYVLDPEAFSGDENIVLVRTKEPHGLRNNDLVVIQGVETVFGDMSGTYRIDTASLIQPQNQFLLYTTLNLSEDAVERLSFEKTVNNLVLECAPYQVSLEYTLNEPGRIITPENLLEHGFIEGRTIRVSGTEFQDGEYTIDCLETRRVPNDTIKLIEQFPNLTEVGPISSTVRLDQSNLLYMDRNTVQLLDGTNFEDLNISDRFIRLDGSSGNDRTYTVEKIDGNQLTVLEEFPGDIGYEYTDTLTISDSIGVENSALTIFYENRFRDFVDLKKEKLPNGQPLERLSGEYVYVDTRERRTEDVPLWGVYRYTRDDFVSDGTDTTFQLSRELKQGEKLITKACGRDDALPRFRVVGTTLEFASPPSVAWDPWNTDTGLAGFEQNGPGTWNTCPWNYTNWNDLSNLDGSDTQGCFWDSEPWDPDQLLITVCYTQPWDLVRSQEPQIDTELFRRSVLYDNETKIIDVYLNIWDPVKNQFPGQLLNEITYKTEYNPAKYNIVSAYEQEDAAENGFDYSELLNDRDLQSIYGLNPDIAWAESKVGELWWDVSQAEYYNYENGTNRERRDNWGRLAQGRAIRIYEWVRSPVPPTQWVDYVQANVGQPAESFQTDKPSGTPLQDSDGEYRYTRIIKRNPETKQNETLYYFWVTDKETVPAVQGRNMSVTQLQRKMTNPTLEGLPWWAPINKDAIIISNIGDALTEQDSIFQLNYNIVQNPNDAHREWVLSREGDPDDVPDDRYWNKMVDSLVGFDRLNQIVPDPNLETGRRYGNFIRPRQTWFVDPVSAGKVFIDKLNEFMSSECVVDTRIGIIDSLSVYSAEPTLYTGGFTTQGSIKIYPQNRKPSEYDRRVSNILERDQLLNLGYYEQIWVDATIETDNFFKVYQYQPNGTWIEVFGETYKLTDFWKTVTYYESGYDATIVESVSVDTLQERNNISPAILFDGFIARVQDSNNDGSNVAAFYEYDSAQADPWTLVAKEQCCIEFDRDLFFDDSYGNPDINTGFTGNQLALRVLCDALRQSILTDLEQNTILYTMIRYVNSEQHVVDWCFKTSYVLISGYNEEVRQDPIQRKSETESFLEFFNEAKPYHTKLRDFVTNTNIGMDTYNNGMTDFDKPVYYDDTIGDYRVLDPSTLADQTIMSQETADQNSWFTNYLDNPELIRTINTEILFDRVSCDIDGGWDSNGGWDAGMNQEWDVSMSNSITQTAANRIWEYYVPSPTNTQDLAQDRVDIRKNLSDLIPGCHYRGVTVDGNLEIENGIQFIDTFEANGIQRRFSLSRPLRDGEFVEIKVCGKIVPQTLNPQAWNSTAWNAGRWNQNDGDIWHLDGQDVVFNVAPNSLESYLFNSWDGDCAWDNEPWDGILTITACVIAVNLIDLNQIDTWINPDPLPNSFADNSQTNQLSNIIVDGHLFRQPDYESGRAEEQMVSAIGESISVTVQNQPAAGAPRMITKKYISDGINEQYSVGQTPASMDALFVFVNGLRQDQSEFILTEQIVEISSDAGDDITIISYTVGGAVTSESLQIFVADGSQTEFILSDTPASSDSVFVVLAGQPLTLGIDYTVTNDVLQMLIVTTAGQEIIVNTFESNLFTRIFTNEFTVTNVVNNRFEIGQNIIAVNPANPLTTSMASPLGNPTFVDSVFVEVNGSRQIAYNNSDPTADYDYLVDFSTPNHEMVFVTKLKLALVGPMNVGDQFTISAGNPTNMALVSISGFTVADLMNDIQSAIVSLADIAATYDDVESNTINLVNIRGGMIEIENVQGTPVSSTFGYTGTDHSESRSLNQDDVVSITSFTNDFIIFTKTYDGSSPFTMNIAHDLVSDTQVEIRVDGVFLGNSDYVVDINENEIQIMNTVGLSLGDQLQVFVYYVGTETFTGNTSGEYMIGQKQIDPTLAIVYYNGLRQQFNIDYSIVDDGTKLVFNAGHTDTDTVIFTGFAGRQSAPPVAFRVFLDNVSASKYQRHAKPFAVSSVDSDVTGSIIKLKYNTGFGLSAYLNGGIIENTVGKMLIVDHTGMSSLSSYNIMDPYGTIDGNAFNVDIIEYTDVQLTEDNCLTMEIVSRNGTNTSRTIKENDIAIVVEESKEYLPNWSAYRISDDDRVVLTQELKLGDTEIKIDRVAGLPKQKPNQSRMDIPGVIWIGDERIEYYERDGTTLKQIRRATGGTSVGIPAVYDQSGNLISDWRTVTEFSYPVGTSVIDASKRQEIPGGYRFDTTGFGLQYTNSVMGRFLQSRPGTC